MWVPPVCTTGADAQSGAPWVVCRADASTAWLSAVSDGTYQPTAICQQLGYCGYDLFGGTCGSVCAYCEGFGKSCAEPGTEFYDGTDLCKPDGGDVLCSAVTWRCIA